MVQSNQIKVRCLVVGPASSGKSTFVKRLTNSQVTNDYQMSTRINLHRKSYAQVNKPYQLEVVFMECPGKDLYHKLLFEVFKNVGSKCLIVGLYDVTNRSSIASLETFLNTLTKQINKSVELCGILLGNKIDLIDKRIISNNEGQQKAKMFKYRYFECSAQNDVSMHEFHQLVVDVIESNFVTNTNSLSLKSNNNIIE